MTELKSVNFGVNQYCVPAVMSALTGRSTDECAAVITSINGRHVIRAVDTSDIIKAFKKLRFDLEEQSVRSRTLYGNLLRLSDNDGLYLIIVPKHIVAIKVENNQVQICDNQSREPLDASASARLTQQVEKIFKVTPKAPPQFIDSYITANCNINNKVDIYKINHYVNSEDDTKEYKGYFYFSNQEELNQILEKLQCLHTNQ